MAAPPHRRPGFSRKAQLRIFAGYLLAFTGAFAGALLLGLSYFDPTGFQALRGTALEITAPISRGFTAMRVGSQTIWHETSAYFDAARKNADLERELKSSRTRLIEARALEQENRQLRRLLNLIEKEGASVASGRLINATASSTRRLATLGVGSLQGVERGQPVRSDTGLVGRILAVGPNTAQILLVSDPENVVPVKRARDGVVAFSQGRSDGRVDIRLINVGVNPFKPGDVMVTSGNGGLYPPNVPVAIIESLTNDGGVGRILANPAATNFVVVQSVYKPEIAATGGTVPPVDGVQTEGNTAQAEGNTSQSPEQP